MIKFVAIGVGAAFLAAWLKTVRTEYSLWILLAAGVLLTFFALTKLETIVEELSYLQNYFFAYGSYFKLLLKIIGITYLAEFSSNLCRDAGANTMASQIELFGKLSILVLCMPIMTSLLQTVDYFLGG